MRRIDVSTEESGSTLMELLEAEKDASELLNTSWRTEPGVVLPIDPMAIARGLGIRVEMIPLPTDESGKIVLKQGESPVMSINRFDHMNRQRFTCAHEIGHYIRRRTHNLDSAVVLIDYRSTLAGIGLNPDEIYANQFAAALLMPFTEVRRLKTLGISISEMALMFGTSAIAMELRLKNLRLSN